MAREDAGNPRSEPRAIAHGMPNSAEIRRRIQLPFRNAVHIAWRNIRVRLGRSVLVIVGIVLALAFLTYIMCSDAMMNHVAASGPADLVERLRADGTLAEASDADTRVQTWWLVGLALLVSFVGILNAMLLSVTERFREIGTMKCLGALDSLIVKLFLLESFFQGVVGTGIGVLIGLLLVGIEGISAVGGQFWSLFPYGQVARLAGLSLAVGTALTVGGAVYPTWRAAKMHPVDAMRLEV